MKKFLILFLFLLFQYNTPNALHAKSTIKVGIYDNEPLIFADAEGNGKGFFADIIEYVASKEGLQIEYVAGTWQQCLSRLENNQIDILCVIAFSKAREKLYDFNKENLLTNWGQLYTSINSGIKEITDVAGKKVAVLKNDIHYKIFTQTIDSFGIECEFIETDDYHSVLNLVFRNQADAGIVNRFFGMKYGDQYRVDKSGVIFNPIKIHFAVPEGRNKTLISSIDKYVSQLKDNHNSVYYQSLDKWFETGSTKWVFPPWIKWLFFIILGFVILLFVGNIILRNQVNTKTKKLTFELKRRKKAEITLRESEKHYRRLFNLLPYGAEVIDLKGNIIDCNPNTAQMLGYKPNELINKHITTIFDSQSIEIYRQKFPSIIKGNIEQADIRMICKDGNKIDVIRTGQPLYDTDGDVVSILAVNIDVTKRKLVEKKLKKSEEEIQSIFRVAPIGIGVVSDRILQQVNEYLCEMLGYSKKELEGKNARICYPTDEDYEYVGKEKYRQIQKYGTGTVETHFKHKNGEIIDILMSSTPLDPVNLSAGVTFTALNISQQKQNERDTQALVESTVGIIGQELFDIIVIKLCGWLDCDCAIIGELASNNTVEAISMILDGAPVQNYSYALKGSPCDETIRKCYCVYPENVCALFPDDPDLIKMDANSYVGAVLKDRKGKTVGVLCAISRSKIQTTQHTQKIMKIIAARVSAEIARKKLRKEKNKLESQLRQAQKMESIGTLAGGIAHDFNNILFPIVGHSEMLLEDVPEDSPFRTGLNQIYIGALRASELVKQILTFSRQESFQSKLMKIQPIIKEALKLIRSTIPTTIDIKQNIQPDCGAIKADPTQIHQIIMNLATNAYHAMEKIGGEMNIRLKQIVLEEPDLFDPDIKSGAYACLSISDTGKGMDNELIEKIFDPFFTTKKTSKGTGMGLSVVHGIVKNMNGAIKAYSEPDKGSEFHIYLPLAEAVKDQQVTPAKRIIQGGTEHILLVDDEKAIIEMEQNMLERLGYRVTSRSSSIETLEAFRAAPDNFDMIITDMAMPNMPGDKLSAELTKIRPDIPILLCTGFSETMSEKEAASLGIKGFLLKPIVMKDLSHKIRKVLDENKV